MEPLSRPSTNRFEAVQECAEVATPLDPSLSAAIESTASRSCKRKPLGTYGTPCGYMTSTSEGERVFFTHTPPSGWPSLDATRLLAVKKARLPALERVTIQRDSGGAGIAGVGTLTEVELEELLVEAGGIGLEIILL